MTSVGASCQSFRGLILGSLAKQLARGEVLALFDERSHGNTLNPLNPKP